MAENAHATEEYIFFGRMGIKHLARLRHYEWMIAVRVALPAKSR